MYANFPESLELFARRAAALVQTHPRRVTALVAAMLLGGTGATFAVASFAPEAADIRTQTVVEALQTTDLSAQVEALAQASQSLFRSEVSRNSDSAASLLRRLGVQDDAAVQFLRNDRLAQQHLLGRGGRNVTAQSKQSGQLETLTARWSPADDGTFRRLQITRQADGSFRSSIESAPLVASTRMASGSIQSSLFAATDEARVPDSVATQMADIFSGDIDFHRALRKGDRFSLVYETLEGDGEPLRSGRVLSAEFVNNGKTFSALWFVPGGTEATAAAKGGYFNFAGDSLRRAYLASPMEFSRVTSGFKMRFHPILQTWRAHLGVDYGAPIGTPVRSVGNGVVEFAGVQNGFGNIVIVKHNASHSTAYAHLSRIAVRKGQTVSQGQNLGAVGQTGWATGPHLHFEFRVNGQQRDPLVMARQSESIPLPAGSRPAFNAAVAQVRAQLASAAQLQTASAQ
ncbi:M23 family metallopeptidase [Curvibacter sp. APW13]|uniref:M23 family metallopeptidase n=1 Tax=Curvibacter sp. APW13 TaxID=3077236 RepID=UPI0028DF8DC6|nr:M23 family metallopeptidase [Curvibacter sp. APW13]MDT8992979.1 M23 family metallopeptidase [Curvibacter sp. APW13]